MFRLSQAIPLMRVLLAAACLLALAAPSPAAINLSVVNPSISVQGWKFVDRDTIEATVSWQLTGSAPQLTNAYTRTWVLEVQVDVIYDYAGRGVAVLATTGKYPDQWTQGSNQRFKKKLTFTGKELRTKGSWTGSVGGGYGEYPIYAKITVTARPANNFSPQFSGAFGNRTPKRSVQLVKKGYGKQPPASASKPSSPVQPVSHTPSPQYKIIKVRKVIREPYTETVQVPVMKTEQKKIKVTRYNTVPKTCTRTKTVYRDVPELQLTTEKVEVQKFRWVPKKVSKKVPVTKYRMVTKQVPVQETKMVEKVVGQKKVTKQLTSTKWVEVTEPYWENVVVTEQRKVTKTRQVPKTRTVTKTVTKTVREPYECKKNVIVGAKPTKPTYETKKVKKFRTERKEVKVKKTVYETQKVRQAKVVTQKVKKYRTVQKKVTQVVYQTRYVTKYRNGRKYQVREKVPRRVTRTVTQQEPYYTTEKKTVHEIVEKKVPVTKVVTEYKTVKVPYYETVKVPVKSNKTTVLYKTVKETCYRDVTKKVPVKEQVTDYVTEKYTVTEPVKVNKKVQKTRTVKKPQQVVREIYSTEPVKKMVPVTKTVHKSQQVKEAYTDYEMKTVTERVREPYTDYEMRRVSKRVMVRKPVTKAEKYDCSEKKPYTEYETVSVQKEVMETKKVTKYRDKVVYEEKRVRVD